MAGSEDWPGWPGRAGAKRKARSQNINTLGHPEGEPKERLDPKTSTCLAILEVSLIFSNSHWREDIAVHILQQ